MKNQNMKALKLYIKNIFIFKILLIIILSNILVLMHCGGGFRQDSENAQEFINPLFNNREFVSDTASDALFTEDNNK
ncbi:MAG: hypothetical protein PVI26_12820 [Chitinispirillia bacterium]|jgi:hypothetical protein